MARVLYLSNSHPALYLGGVEVYSYELFQAMRESGTFEPVLLARVFPARRGDREDTRFFSIGREPDQVLWVPEHYDDFFMTCSDKKEYTDHFQRCLAAYEPDVVHIQHTIGLGIDLIRQIRNGLPKAPIVYTLHEFLPICHANGLLLRRDSGELCRRATPASCHGCFPEIPAREFFLRERQIKAAFRHVDLFLAPSRQLLDRFVEWGIPRDRIRFLDYGRVRPASASSLDENGPPATSNVGFFGQLKPHKGVSVLMKAIRLLVEEGDGQIRLFINGANLETESEDFRKEFARDLEACGCQVTFLGKYEPSEITERMREVAWVVVPSIWWENSPLVIQEAFMHRRPVICSDVGGMAEKVRDGVDGLHFRTGDAADLAAVLRRATRSPDLWEKLRAGVREVYSMDEAVAAHAAIYRSLLGDGETGAPAP